VLEELDVSGGKPLDERPGLSAAVASIEAGNAEVVASAYSIASSGAWQHRPSH